MGELLPAGKGSVQAPMFSCRLNLIFLCFGLPLAPPAVASLVCQMLPGTSVPTLLRVRVQYGTQAKALPMARAMALPQDAALRP